MLAPSCSLTQKSWTLAHTTYRLTSSNFFTTTTCPRPSSALRTPSRAFFHPSHLHKGPGESSSTGKDSITMAPDDRFAAKAKGKSVEPSPSASIILVSPTNRILLLHRLRTSSAFPAAHVFPGGNLDPSDGPIAPSGKERHVDNLAYRTGAIRELFEESGVLLAKGDSGAEQLLEVSDRERKEGRKAIHARQVGFAEWLERTRPGARLDTEGLIPFTHWVTPPNVPKRYTTQMYVYFVPVGEEGNESVKAVSADEVETTAAEWGFAEEWTRRARGGEIILFPPQYLLLDLCGGFLGAGERGDMLLKGREGLRKFILEDGSPAWKDKYISPIGLSFGRKDGRAVLALDKPGPELKDTGLRGDSERVVLVKFNKEGPREVEVRWRKDVLEEERMEKEARGGSETPKGKEMADVAIGSGKKGSSRL